MNTTRNHPPIRLLNEETINQIAAGEVIENASSVVKELIDNSIDSGASFITVEILSGGRQLIRVTDNGCGMSKEDAELCLQRHATSKIQSLEDISQLTTMGFRGEALPSIASISKLSILTRSRDSQIVDATLIKVEGGRLIDKGSATRDPGTTIEIAALFYNVPVRRKFQKSVNHDSAQVLHMVSQLALGNPNIDFKLYSNEKLLLSTSACYTHEKLYSRIHDVLGKEFLDQAQPISWQEGEWKLTGYISQPSYTRNNRTGQHLFINSRPIFSPFISYVVSESYGPLLPTKRFPLFVLYLDLPSGLIDVNVHPQKKEVRLRDPQTLRKFIIHALETAWAPTQHSSVSQLIEEPYFVKEERVPYWTDEPPMQPLASTFTPLLPLSTSGIPASLPFQEFSYPILAIWPPYILLNSFYLNQHPSNPFTNQNGLVYIDQRLAHARVLYEGFLDQLENRAQKITSQGLLIPIQLQFSAAETHLLDEFLDELNAMGISIRSFGHQTFVIDSMPDSLHNEDIHSLMLDLIENLRHFSHRSHATKEKKIQAALSASQMATKRTKHLTLIEAEMLVHKLLQCQMPFQSPMGKPTMVLISKEDLAKKF